MVLPNQQIKTSHRKHVWVWMVFAFGLLSMHSHAHAQPQQGQWNLHADFGYSKLGDYGLADLQHSFMWRTHLDYHMTKRWLVGLGYQQQSGLSILDDDAILQTIELIPTYLFHPDKKHGAFAQASLGYQWIRLDQIENTTGVAFGLAGGLRSQWSDLIATYLGFGYDYVHVADPIHQGQHNLTAWLGFSLTLNPGPLTPRPPSSMQVSSSILTPPNACQKMSSKERKQDATCQLDQDDDGVADFADLCPATQKVEVDEVGCPRKHFARGIIQNIDFESGSARVTYQSLKTLKKIANALMQNKDSLLYTVEGHTDSLGDRKTNEALSLARAKTVMNILTRNGLSSHRIDAIGYGQDYPIANNETRAGRNQNRRVEIKWLVVQ